MEEIEKYGEPGGLWDALITQCQSEQKHSIREVHQQLRNIEMVRKQSLEAHHGRVQQLKKQLEGTEYKISDANQWGNLTDLISDVYGTSFRIINISFEELPYHELMAKLQDIARGEVGDQTVPLENQRKVESTSEDQSTTEKNSTKEKFKGR